MTNAIITTRVDGGVWQANFTITGQPPPSGIPPIEGTESAAGTADGSGDTPDAAEAAAKANMRTFLVAALAEMDK